jgi:1-phosphofructokinase
MPRLLTVTLNPAIDLRLRFETIQPGGLNRARDVALEPSGKGINVARALARQGLEVTALALLGGPFGTLLEESLRSSDGLHLVRVPIAGETRCNVKALDQSRSAVTELNAPGPTIRPAELEMLRETLRSEVRAGDLVVLSGSLPVGVPADTYASLLRDLSSLGAETFLDADGEALRAGLAMAPFVIKPNRLEAQTLLGLPIVSRQDALEAARRFLALGARHVVLSLGADGAMFATKTETVFAKPPAVPVHSTVGSGDALLSGVVAARTRNLTWTETARYATAVAAARVTAEHLEFPDPVEIQALLGRVEISLEP